MAILGILIFAFAVVVFFLLIVKFSNLVDQKNRKKLKKYQPIEDVYAEAEKIKAEQDAIIKQVEAEIDKAKADLKSIKGEYARYDFLVKEAEIKEFDFYEIEYSFGSSDEYKAKLNEIREKCKALVKNKEAVRVNTNYTLNGSKTEGAKLTSDTSKLLLLVLNNEVETILEKVRFDNLYKMLEQLDKKAEAIDKLGSRHGCHIKDSYVNLKKEEIKLVFEYQQKVQEEKDEIRRVKEQIREEEKAAKEAQAAAKKAADEESKFQELLAKAQADAESAVGDKHEKMMQKIAELQAKLESAQQMKERATSMAQLTKSGFVYIISNIGSFGENVFKIGMTRRLEPLDRVRELGDASVPFFFDVHALIPSDDAPTLEKEFHSKFQNNRVNMVSDRREFFRVNIKELERFIKDKGVDVDFNREAVAQEFRESQKIISELEKNISNN